MNARLMNILCALSAALLADQSAVAADPGYHLIKEISIGDEGGWRSPRKPAHAP